ncbi:MAG: alpha/beta hydrolase [Planctomycetaceae bacterium]|nr:alpha/beta hydrolase [Planctomycetaceae bacterium]
MRWIALLLLPLSTGCISPAIARFEQANVYQPAGPTVGNWSPQGIDIEDAWFASADGTELHGWYVPHPHPRAVVLVCHGNAGNVTHRANLIRSLHAHHDVALLVFDYRGFGRSTGTPNEQGILSDARAARGWLADRTGQREEDIVLFGRSLGGGVAVDLAAHDGARGLVLVNTFSSLPEVARHHMSLLPAGLLMKNRLASADKIDAYHGPLLQLHARDDKVIPARLGSKLHAAANDPKQLLLVDGMGHNGPLPVEFHRAFHAFVDALP